MAEDDTEGEFDMQDTWKKLTELWFNQGRQSVEPELTLLRARVAEAEAEAAKAKAEAEAAEAEAAKAEAEAEAAEAEAAKAEAEAAEAEADLSLRYVRQNLRRLGMNDEQIESMFKPPAEGSVPLPSLAWLSKGLLERR